MLCILFKQRLFLTTGKFASDLPDITTSNAYRMDSMYCGSFINSRLMEYRVTIDAQEETSINLNHLVNESIYLYQCRHIGILCKWQRRAKITKSRGRRYVTAANLILFSKITDMKIALKNRLKWLHSWYLVILLLDLFGTCLYIFKPGPEYYFKLAFWLLFRWIR